MDDMGRSEFVDTLPKWRQLKIKLFGMSSRDMGDWLFFWWQQDRKIHMEIINNTK